jgi:hypothetical protein
MSPLPRPRSRPVTSQQPVIRSRPSLHRPFASRWRSPERQLATRYPSPPTPGRRSRGEICSARKDRSHARRVVCRAIRRTGAPRMHSRDESPSPKPSSFVLVRANLRAGTPRRSVRGTPTPGKGSAAACYPGCSGREPKATGYHTAVERLDRRERRRTTPTLIAATSAAKHSKENPLPGPPPAAAAPGDGADGPPGGSGVFDFPGDPSDCRDPLRWAGVAEAG